MGQDTYSQAPRRTRVSRACERCRSKRDKCDGLRPTCSSCKASGQECAYNPHPKKRGLPEGYVRGLEKLWAFSICKFGGLEDSLLGMLGSAADYAGQREKFLRFWTNDATSEVLHKSWKTSRLFHELNKILTDSATPDNNSRGTGSPFSDDWEFNTDLSSRQSQRATDLPNIKYPLPLQINAPPAPTAGLQLPSHASYLLKHYFAVTHTWFPIISKQDILQASYVYSCQPMSLMATAPRSGENAVLWAILSYTASQSRIDSPDGESLAETKDYYKIARSLIPAETEHYDIGHIQALLLLALINIGLEKWTSAWLLSGQAVRMALSIDLGDHAGAVNQKKAVFLGCFVIDSLLSFRISRRPCMQTRDLTAVGLMDENGPEEWKPWPDALPATKASKKDPDTRNPLRAISCFNRLVELAIIVNKISTDTTGSSYNALATQLISELKQLDDRLPPECRLVSPESHYFLLPHHTYFRLTYAATLVWIYVHIAPHERSLEQPAIQEAERILYKAPLVLSQYLENFHMCGSVPPLFELSVRTIVEQAFALRAKMGRESLTFDRCEELLLCQVKELRSSWPVFHSLISNIEHWTTHKGRPESSLVFIEPRNCVQKSIRLASTNSTTSELLTTTETDSGSINTDASIHPSTGVIHMESIAPVRDQYVTDVGQSNVFMESSHLQMSDPQKQNGTWHHVADRLDLSSQRSIDLQTSAHMTSDVSMLNTMALVNPTFYSHILHPEDIVNYGGSSPSAREGHQPQDIAYLNTAIRE
ncbi:fungal-specific transcription factor domain-containing protein [Aspergillus ambiguus]|uniref:transcription factor domain-containing protein n=1 Tax=Aspergillus ambiguus TaxID=176160 RepID=UPI003CCDD7FC